MSSSRLFTPWWRRLVALAATATLLAACGGGGGDAPAPGAPNPPTVTATSFDTGPISGFGSVIVNGVRFDDSGASVFDDEGNSRSRDELRLGMMVEVDGLDVDRGRGLGRALRIRFGSEIVGPVSAVNVNASTFGVLGQTVEVRPVTVFDDTLPGGLAALTVGAVVEVHALFDAASGRYVATRIEPEGGALIYKLRGTVANLNTTAKTFTIGGATINYASVTELPSNLANGSVVRVKLQTAQVNGQWVATSLRSGVRNVEDRPDVELRGTITAFTSATAFEVNGLKIDASSAAFPDGTAGIVLGAMVEVEGRLQNGVLIASKVELEDAPGKPDDDRFELNGTVGALDTNARTFVLRGVRVSYANVVEWKDGGPANLANGVKVEVKGMPSADGTTLVASRIEFDD